MNQELTKAQLLEMAIADFAGKNTRLEAIQSEMDKRLADVSEIQDRITRNGVRSLADVVSLLEDLENHLARVKELEQETDLIMADYVMDMDAIAKAPR